MHGKNIVIKDVKKAANYYRDNIEILRQDARNKYRNLSENKSRKGSIKETDIT